MLTRQSSGRTTHGEVHPDLRIAERPLRPRRGGRDLPVSLQREDVGEADRQSGIRREGVGVLRDRGPRAVRRAWPDWPGLSRTTREGRRYGTVMVVPSP